MALNHSLTLAVALAIAARYERGGEAISGSSSGGGGKLGGNGLISMGGHGRLRCCWTGVIGGSVGARLATNCTITQFICASAKTIFVQES